MTAIEELKQRLARHAGLNYKITDSTLAVDSSSPDGFSVAIIETASEWIVYFDGWHEHFDSKDEALHCFVFGLSDQCRLQITLRGNFPYRWTLQSKSAHGWVTDSTTGLLLFPCWRRKRIQYRQNSILKGTEPWR